MCFRLDLGIIQEIRVVDVSPTLIEIRSCVCAISMPGRIKHLVGEGHVMKLGVIWYWC